MVNLRKVAVYKDTDKTILKYYGKSHGIFQCIWDDEAYAFMVIEKDDGSLIEDAGLDKIKFINDPK